MSDKETPLMLQYSQIKAKHPDAVLLFRMGDFFETFGEDAILTAKVCGITLTKRNNGGATETPLAGFPHHQLDVYLPKLVRAGHRVAVCEQIEDPKLARGIVKRDVVEVVTPGVALYDRLLDAKTNTYIASVAITAVRNGQAIAGVAYCDVSTGEFKCCQLPLSRVGLLLETLVPAEIVIPKSALQDMTSIIANSTCKPAVTKLDDWLFDYQFGFDILTRQFKTNSLTGFGIQELDSAIRSGGALLHYVKETQRGDLLQFTRVSLHEETDYMVLDGATRKNLEIFYSNVDDSGATLFSILDRTLTSAGGRLFKHWLSRPLRSRERINNRLGVVNELNGSKQILESVRASLSAIQDIDRLTTKICTGRANPRDIIALLRSLQRIPDIKTELNRSAIEVLMAFAKRIPDSSEVMELIEKKLVEDPSVQLGTGNVFRDGVSDELDEVREAMYSGKNWILQVQERERNETGISSLKVSFNNVFGYYIEVSNAHKEKVPTTYHRKQTLVNAERFTTPELKEIESKILNAESNISEIETRLFAELRLAIAEHTEVLQRTSVVVSELDALQSFAHIALEYQFVQPILTDGTELEIVEGRHAVVERCLPIGTPFVPNSTSINTTTSQIHIITGPNMAGKSCYLRQIGLIALLAHVGSFVPARSATIGLIDRIFTRVGAQDNISAGESTFLVEMQETANILNNATERSLILLDEVGRGTATFDGISIAWALAEYLHDVIGAKTLFATHYHELTDLATQFERIKNYCVEVHEHGSTILFTRKVKSGSSDHSFGIHVAQMAGLPKTLTERANDILSSLEKEKGAMLDSSGTARNEKSSEDGGFQMSMFELKDDALREKLRALNLDEITPLQALQVLAELRNESDR